MTIDAQTNLNDRLRGVCRLRGRRSDNPWRHLSCQRYRLKLGQWALGQAGCEVTTYEPAEAARAVLSGAIFLSIAHINERTNLPTHLYHRNEAELWLPVTETLEQQFQNGQIPCPNQ